MTPKLAAKRVIWSVPELSQSDCEMEDADGRLSGQNLIEKKTNPKLNSSSDFEPFTKYRYFEEEDAFLDDQFLSSEGEITTVVSDEGAEEQMPECAEVNIKSNSISAPLCNSPSSEIGTHEPEQSRQEAEGGQWTHSSKLFQTSGTCSNCMMGKRQCLHGIALTSTDAIPQKSLKDKGFQVKPVSNSAKRKSAKRVGKKARIVQIFPDNMVKVVWDDIPKEQKRQNDYKLISEHIPGRPLFHVCCK